MPTSVSYPETDVGYFQTKDTYYFALETYSACQYDKLDSVFQINIEVLSNLGYVNSFYKIKKTTTIFFFSSYHYNNYLFNNIRFSSVLEHKVRTGEAK